MPQITGKRPTARFGHSQVMMESRSLLIIGGWGDQLFSDIWLLNLRTMTWSEIKVNHVTVGFHDGLRNFNENHGNFTLIFFKSKNQTEIPITLRYFTAGIGNAVINTDYTNISHSFTFKPSQFNKDFVFPNTPTIINNNIVEATKCFNMSLESTNPNVVYTIQQSKICILNDDKVLKRITPIYGNALFLILSMVERYFETAVKNVDYTDRNNDIITIEKNESKKSVEIKIKNDDEAESIEVFAVGLEAIDSSTTLIGSKNMAVVRITDQVDRDQEKRAKMISILLFVSIGIIIIISAVLIIALCLIHRWTKKNTK
ncbi:hypothetical protein QZH41_010373 [Actinostola sp. cb2023]|nr:hypothetical protein QZH41_010373 [Actinostola sp. cb2023]